MAHRPAPADSRTRLLVAAAAEFAARGYEGANVDRIARAARLNKAMIYYHFKSKAALYTEIFREFIHAVLDDIRAVADSDRAPADKIRAFVTAIATAALARPHFPPMWLREVAGGARRVDRATLDLIGQVPAILGRIVAEGQAAGVFQARHPLLVHFGIVGPLVLYHVSRPIRAHLLRAGAAGASSLDPADVLDHIVQSTLAALAPDPSPRRAASSARRAIDPQSGPPAQGRRS